MSVTYIDAIRAAQESLLRDDPRVFLYGQDIGRFGGSTSFGGSSTFTLSGSRNHRPQKGPEKHGKAQAHDLHVEFALLTREERTLSLPNNRKEPCNMKSHLPLHSTVFEEQEIEKDAFWKILKFDQIIA